jgi:hypothetical protein
MARGLQEFKRVAADFTDLGALAIKFAVAAPFIGVALKIGPPPAQTVSTLTCMTEVLALIWTFHFWSFLSAAQQKLRMRLALGLFCLFLLGSITGTEAFTISPGPGRDRVVEGYELHAATQRLIGPTFSPEDALRAAQFDPSEVWTQRSITVIHSGLIVCWIAAFTAITIYLSLFVIAQRKKKAASAAKEVSS